MKWKKPFFRIIGILAVLIICNYIGQNFVKPAKEKIGYEEQSVENIIKDVSIEDLDWTYDGIETVKDNPWGYNIGIIDMENGNKALFMTPETNAAFSKEKGISSISLKAKIHPWIASKDGVLLTIYIEDKNTKEILQESSYSITESEQDIQINLEEYKNQDINIKLHCNSGEDGDREGDWLIVYSIKAEGIHQLSENIAINLEKDNYIKATHYFADEWPINFWNSELDNLEQDIENIKKDGFNSIVLVIPWREFQISMNPIQYNDYSFKMLDKIFEVTNKFNIEVMLRIGYTWDFYNSKESVLDRYYMIMNDENVKKAWFDYVETMYNFSDKYENFLGGFICWEDFWNNVSIAKGATEENKLQLADFMGYQEYLKENYSLKEINDIYQEDFQNYNEVYLPNIEKREFKLFYEFYDFWLNHLLEMSQQYFPNLSMEVRVDADLVKSKNNKDYEYYQHTETYYCKNSDFTTIVYGIPMGFENKGERVSAEEALKMTSTILGNINKVTNNKPIFIDQFLFSDNTPQFSYNAQIKEDEIADYLYKVSDILAEQVWGHGIWTYHDYRSNMLYNSQFALEKNGWTTEGTVMLVKDDSNKLLLENNSSITQIIPEEWVHFKNQDKIYFEIEANPLEQNSKLAIYVGDNKKEIEVNEKNNYIIEFPYESVKRIQIECIGKIEIDNLYLYTFIQTGKLYSADGKEESAIEALRKMHQRIDQILSEKQKNKPFYSFTENYKDSFAEGLYYSDDFITGKSADKISVEGYGECLFLSPRNLIEYQVKLDEKNRVLTFSTSFYPDAKAWGSDGASIIVTISNGKEQEEYKYNIQTEEEITLREIKLDKYLGETITINFKCTSGNSKDEIGDWILLVEPTIK